VYHKEAGIIDSPFTVRQFRLLPKTKEAVELIRKKGFKTIVASNQPGILKGNFTKKTLMEITSKMTKKLGIDAVYYCLHHPDFMRCSCRKPKAGLLFKAAHEMNIELRDSFMIGDSWADIATGKKAGCRTILLGNAKCDACKLLQKNNAKPDYIVKDLYEASKLIAINE
jgi:histidinol-phosphate phosphatase family protein